MLLLLLLFVVEFNYRLIYMQKHLESFFSSALDLEAAAGFFSSVTDFSSSLGTVLAAASVTAGAATADSTAGATVSLVVVAGAAAGTTASFVSPAVSSLPLAKVFKSLAKFSP
jgi:hypothetical protein